MRRLLLTCCFFTQCRLHTITHDTQKNIALKKIFSCERRRVVFLIPSLYRCIKMPNFKVRLFKKHIFVQIAKHKNLFVYKMYNKKRERRPVPFSVIRLQTLFRFLQSVHQPNIRQNPTAPTLYPPLPVSPSLTAAAHLLV